VLRRLATPRWLLRHALVVAVVVTFTALARWQFRRATGGNALSWGYTLEWPLFAGFVVAMWVRAVRDELRGTGAGTPRREPPPPIRRVTPPIRQATPGGEPPTDRVPGADEDPDLAEYNRYLAWLAAHPDRGPGDYPG
jgi:hypothetical protein